MSATLSVIFNLKVQPFGIWLLRIISPLSRTGKYRRKQLSRLPFRLLGLGDGFPFFILIRYFPRVRELTIK